MEDVFSEVAVARLKTYISQPHLVDQFAEIANPDDAVMNILVAGHRRAGKGALLNALTDASGTGSFKESGLDDDVVSMEIKGICYTSYHLPENGVNELPEALAELLPKADHLMLVHDPGVGHLRRSELDFLELLRESDGFDPASRLSLVLSHREAYETIIQDLLGFILQQIDDSIGLKPQVFMVSYARYLKGVLLDKPAFTERSGIPDLQQMLSELMNDRSLRVAGRIGDSGAEVVARLRAEIDAAIDERKAEMQRLEEHLDKTWSALVADMERLSAKYEERLTAYEAEK